MFKIAHISDTHLRLDDINGGGKAFVELMEDIKKKNCDHVILSGDLVDNVNEKDFRFAKELLKNYDLVRGDKFTLVPGNHDIFGGAEMGIEGLKFIFKCSNADYDLNVKIFAEHFNESFPETIEFPYLKIFDNVAIIALNSIDRWDIKKNPEGSNGRIDKMEFENLEKLLSIKKIKKMIKIVVLHHHFGLPESTEENPAHPVWLAGIDVKMKLYGKKKLLKLLEKYKVKMILHGHTHISEIYTKGNIVIINSSASAIPLTDDRVRSYHIIEIPGKKDEEREIKIEKVIIP
ncbi:MAG TPA: metallophosphoesterase [Ignavibacteria bacterium]|mgnify:CR=1 FL=1|nr:metallophosphoesterase [Ignavibacteria bacterium]HQY51912.1 metallophosphoesterase [Ignavibacteria bacterium]HRA99969.1 metallophosphoesterase [Ignavibacteria bacterium]